jgi:superfamily II DNA or RNA helicase
MVFVLRDYQLAALDSLRAEIRANRRRLCLVAPTGSGKTSIAAEMIHGATARGNAVLFLAHRKELIEQASARLDSVGVDHGVMMADHPRRNSLPVQVASIQTLVRRKFPPAQLVIVDECHHAAADSYGRIWSAYSDAWIIGLTATPWRSDGRGLAELFDASVVAATPAELMARGYLCRYTGYAYAAPNLKGVRTVGGDFEQQELGERCSESRLVGDVVSQWEAHASGMKTVLFAVNIRHATALAQEFAGRGIAAEVVHHELAKQERDAVIQRLRSGETRIVCNVGILGEGVDIPDLQCAVLARPTKSLALYLQQVGRILRPAPGKESARIHDHGECVARHGLPDDARDYTLEATRETQLASVSQTRQCPKCFALMRRETPWPCPECKYQPNQEELRAKEPKRVSGEGVTLDEMRARQLQRPTKLEMDLYLSTLVRMAIEKGWRPGAVVHRFCARYPFAPKPWGAFRKVKDAQANW